MKWELPPKIKIYEALGCIADGRITVEGNTAKVYSSSGNKFYDVTYDSEANAIMANDNGSYWKGYLGYPSIAFLMVTGIIPYSQKFSECLKGIAWKDLNTKFKNNFDKTTQHIQESLVKNGVNIPEIEHEIDAILKQLEKQSLNILGNKIKPPQGY